MVDSVALLTGFDCISAERGLQTYFTLTFSPLLTSQTMTLSSAGHAAYWMTCSFELPVLFLMKTTLAFRLQTTPKQADCTYLR